MKIQSLFVFLFVAIAINAAAQQVAAVSKAGVFISNQSLSSSDEFNSDAKKRFSFGLRVGLNMATERIANSNKSYIVVGNISTFLFGVYAKWKITPKIDFQPELFYSSLGASLSDPIYTKLSGYVETNYLSLPALLRFNISPHVYFVAGPQFNFFLNGNTNFDLSLYPGLNYSNVDANRIDLAAVIGLGLDVGAFNLGVRYNYGFTNIDPGAQGNFSVKNMTMQFIVGYRLLAK